MTNEITIVTPEQVELKFELAGLGSRFVALLTDSLIQGLVTFAVSMILFAVPDIGPAWMNTMSPWVIAIYMLLLFALWGGYFLFFEAFWNGQTPGKKSIGIRVIRDSGHPVDFRSALLRNMMRLVDSLPGMYGVGMLSIFLSPQYRRLGDYVAGTLVVKTQQKPKAAKNVRMRNEYQSAVNTQVPVESGAPVGEPLLPMEAMPYVASITKDEYRAVRHFLDRQWELDQKTSLDLSAKIADPLMKKLHIEPGMITDKVLFLHNLSVEWERRMIH